MTDSPEPNEMLPPDPTFHPSAYDRTSRLMRAGVVGFFVLTAVGMVINLVTNPTETVGTLLSSGAATELGSLLTPLSGLSVFVADPLILLGIAILIAVTVGRVFLATIDLFRGGERILASICLVVVGLLLVGLFLIPQFVH
jgi:uncharacterized membrane protein